MQDPEDARRPRLVPELAVVDVSRSLAFWCDLVGFRILYDRPEEGFAYLEREGVEVMLDQYHPGGRHWLAAPFAPPLGNGANLQFEVSDSATILARLAEARWPLVMDVEDKWYRAGDHETGLRQFVVADPDGYRLRPAQLLGLRRL